MKIQSFWFTLLLLGIVSTSWSQSSETVLNERFNNNNNGWTTGNIGNGIYSIYSGHYYIEHKATEGRAYTTIPLNIDKDSDFEYTANIKHNGGVKNFASSIVFGAKDANNQYSFSITFTGFYRVSKYENGRYSELQKWVEHSAVNKGTGAINKLTVIEKGGNTFFYVNNVNVHTESSLTMFGNQIGLELYNQQKIIVPELWVYGTKKTDAPKKEKVIFYDDFADNTNKWSAAYQAKADLYLRNGKYYFSHKQDEKAWMTNKTFTIDESRNFYIETAIQKISGVDDYGYGLTWGRKDWENYLTLNISSNGYYRIGKEENNEWTNIKAWTKSSYVKQGNRATNILKMAKVGNEMKIYINNKFIYKAPYEPFLGNRVGFEIYRRQEVAIDYLKIAYTSRKSTVKKNLPPVIVITEPKVSNSRDFNIVKTNTVHVAGRAIDDDNIQSVLIDGKEAYLYSDGRFSANIPANNSKDIIIKATDKRGLSSSKTIKMKVESNPVIDNPTVDVTNPNQKRLALVIGNGQYTGAGILKNPVNDARSMKSALESLGFTVLKYEDCSQRTMKQAIDEFGKELKNYDIGFFFYAGHGLQVNGANYLIPVDATLSNEDDVEYDCVRADRVMAKMETANSKTNIIVLDACRNNPFERSWARSTNGNGLAFMNAPQGSLIAYATSPGNTAADGQGSNGLYTSALLKHIKEPNMGIEAIFKKVRQDVIKQSNGQQTPWESTSLTGDFYFVKK